MLAVLDSGIVTHVQGPIEALHQPTDNSCTIAMVVLMYLLIVLHYISCQCQVIVTNTIEKEKLTGMNHLVKRFKING